MASASELSRGLEAERVMPRPRRLSESLLGSWWASPSPAEPRVTELPAFLREVLQEPGASVGGALFRSWRREREQFETLETIHFILICSFTQK